MYCIFGAMYHTGSVKGIALGAMLDVLWAMLDVLWARTSSPRKPSISIWITYLCVCVCVCIKYNIYIIYILTYIYIKVFEISFVRARTARTHVQTHTKQSTKCSKNDNF